MQSRASLYVRSQILAENLDKVRGLVRGKELIAMVKADAYGHGLAQISRELVHQQVKILGVASLAEALELRRNLSNEYFDIYVFSDIQLEDSENISFYSDFRITPVISNLTDLTIFLNEAQFANFPLILKFNTGMNRLGFDWQNAAEVGVQILKSGRKSIAHVMSHFATASQNINLANNSRQQEHFAHVLSELRACGLEIEATSLANSGAIEQGAGLEHSHVRPGLILYGPSSLIPTLESSWQGRIISSLKVRVLQTRSMKKGEPVGYGATPLSKDGLLLVAAIGYGDGFNNRYQKVKFEVKTQRGEIIPVDVVGRVNMDMVQLLAPAETKIQANEELIFWDDDPRGLKLLCHNAKIIPYEVLCQLSVRVPRIFTLT